MLSVASDAEKTHGDDGNTVVTTKVLIIEDDPNIVDLIRSNLAVRGFDTVALAGRGPVLDLLEAERPDMVLLDLMLPEADGFELAARSASAHRSRSSWSRPGAASATRSPR